MRLNSRFGQISKVVALTKEEKVEDQDTAMILKWPEVVAVVLVLMLLLGGG